MTKVPPWRPDASAVEVAVTALAVSVSIRAGFDVILSVDDDPVSLARREGIAASALSSAKVSDALPVLPAASVSLATTVWEPLTRPVGVKLQAPDASEVAVPAMALPSTVKWTTALAAPLPVRVGFDVILSVDDDPVSLARPAVMAAVGEPVSQPLVSG